MTVKQIYGKVIRIATVLLASLVVFSFIIGFLVDSGALYHWYRNGTIDLDVTNRDSVLVIRELSDNFLASGTRPQRGDTLLAIDNVSAGLDSVIQALGPTMPVGTRHTILFQSEGDTLSAVLEANRPTASSVSQTLLIHIMRYVVVLSFAFVGILGLYKRLESPGVRALAFFSLSLGGMMIQVVTYRLAFRLDMVYGIDTFAYSLINFLAQFTSALWLNLHLLFPRPAKLMRERPFVAYLLCYGVYLLAFLITRFTGDGADRIIAYIVIPVIIAQYTAGFVLLTRNLHRPHSALERRQTSLVMKGTAVGLGTFTVLMAVVLIGGAGFINGLSSTVIILIVMMLFLSMLMIPVTFLIAFNRHGLLDVEAKVRRGTQYTITTGILLIGMLVIVLLLSNLMVSVLGIVDRTPVLILAVVMAAGIAPIQRRSSKWLEDRFYPERRRLRSMLSDFVRRAATLPDREALRNELETSLKDGLRVTTVETVYYDSERAFTGRDDLAIPLDANGGLVREMRERARPISVDEWQAEAGMLNPAEDAWLKSENISLLLPLTTASDLRGIIALGEKAGDEAFRPEEVLILSTLANQIALTVENLSLLEENLEKRRLQEQLDLARDIQQGFLPQTIPDTPGLDVAATSLFSLEVAGDYYDVMQSEDGRTFIAVGDVSGKGAGAALIMANLQASLRALVRVGADLADMVSGINDIICHNTPPEAYVTFFVSEHSPNGDVRYVNAGHNPPMLLRVNGKVEELHSGGLILGMLPGIRYDVGYTKLRKGDVLVLFTDGVTEAMNAKEVEFGEERLLKAIISKADKTSEKMVAEVRKRVIAFSGDEHFADDFTLVITRAVGKGGKNSSPRGKGAKSSGGDKAKR